MSASSKKGQQVQLGNPQRTAHRDATKRSGTTGGTSGGDQSKQGATSAQKGIGVAQSLQNHPLTDGLGVYMSNTGDIHNTDLAFNRANRASGVNLIGANSRLTGGKSNSVHSQKHIATSKIEQLRASSVLAQDQYGQGPSFDNGQNSYVIGNQS